MICNSLYGGTFAGSGIPIKKNITCTLSLNQGFGVLQNQIFLTLISNQLFNGLIIRMFNRGNQPLLVYKHIISGINAITFNGNKFDSFLVFFNEIDFFSIPSGKVSIVFGVYTNISRTDLRNFLKDFQFT